MDLKRSVSLLHQGGQMVLRLKDGVRADGLRRLVAHPLQNFRNAVQVVNAGQDIDVAHRP